MTADRKHSFRDRAGDRQEQPALHAVDPGFADHGRLAFVQADPFFRLRLTHKGSQITGALHLVFWAIQKL